MTRDRPAGASSRREHVLAILNDVGRVLASTLDLDELCTVIYEQTCRLVDVATFQLVLYDLGTETVARELVFDGGEPCSKLAQPLDCPILASVVRSRQPALFGTLAERRLAPDAPGDHPVCECRHRAESLLVIPLVATDRVIGVLAVQSHRFYAYREADVEVLTIVAGQAAVAIENARLYGEQKRMIGRLRALQQVTAELNRGLVLSQTPQALVEQPARVFGADRAAVYLRPEPSADPVCVASFGLSDEYIEAVREHYDRSIGGLAQESRRVLVIADAPTDPRLASLHDAVVREGYRSGIVLPLVHGDQALGTLVFYHDSRREYAREEIDLASTFAEQVTIALVNAELYQTAVQTKRNLEAIVDAMGEGLIVSDSGGRILLANPVVYELFGLDRRRELTGRHLIETLEAVADRFERPGQIRERLERLLHGHRAQEPDLIEVVKPERRFLRPVVAPMHGEAGELVGHVMLLHDVTLETEAQRIQHEFLSMVSHELRTPLTSIKGYAQILARRIRQRKPIDGQALAIIDEQAVHMVKLIDDLLSIAQMERGQFQVRRSPVDLGALVLQVVEHLRPTAEGHVLEVVPPDRDVTVRGDPLRLREVAGNLVGNAIKYSPDGGRITVAISPARPAHSDDPTGVPDLAGLCRVGWDESPDHVVVSIVDEGIGIAADQQQQVFERFYQVDRSRTRRFGGVGLGLYISKGIVEAHGGRIWVTSTPGQGSVFSFSLPLESLRMVTA